MTTPSPRPKRGFLAAFQSAMAPAVPEDDGKPIARPRIVTIGSALTIAAALLFLFAGLGSILTKGSAIEAYKQNYVEVVNECKTYVGGIGSAVPSGIATPSSASGPAPASLLPSGCSTLQTEVMSASDVDSLNTGILSVGIAFSLAAVVVGIAGWYLRDAYKWARRTLVVVALLSLAAAVLFGVSGLPTLLGTFLLVVGLVLTYVGKGSLYFLRVAMRRSKHA